MVNSLEKKVQNGKNPQKEITEEVKIFDMRRGK